MKCSLSAPYLVPRPAMYDLLDAQTEWLQHHPANMDGEGSPTSLPAEWVRCLACHTASHLPEPWS